MQRFHQFKFIMANFQINFMNFKEKYSFTKKYFILPQLMIFVMFIINYFIKKVLLVEFMLIMTINQIYLIHEDSMFVIIKLFVVMVMHQIRQKFAKANCFQIFNFKAFGFAY